MAFLIRIDGIPVPQGSKTATVINGRAVMFDSNKKLKTWRDQVTAAAQNLMRQENIETSDGPVGVVLMFILPRPKTVKRSLPSVKPDIDKLIRAVFDSLTTAGLWKGDEQVVYVSANKRYQDDEHDTPGVIINVFAKYLHSPLD